MLGLKIVIYTFIFLSCSLIGILVSNKYRNRVNELKMHLIFLKQK